jgi:type IV pilus assembly protein PilO
MAAFNISLDVIKNMSLKRKILIFGVFYLLLAAAYYFFVLQSSFEQKASLQAKLSVLQEQVAEKERLASQKNRYLQELSERREQLRLALTKLPDQREIPGLLYSVAQAGRDAGVDFLLFEPKRGAPAPPPPVQPQKGAAAAPVSDKFYEEIPVQVTVTGSYHNTALFFEKVAKLPRIINIEDVIMSEGKNVKGRDRSINTSCVIKTYMFLEKMGEKKADEKK